MLKQSWCPTYNKLTGEDAQADLGQPPTILCISEKLRVRLGGVKIFSLPREDFAAKVGRVFVRTA